ncbi:ABC transporter ATP-binding protein [Streptomyces qinglanensis]|uniref:ABC transporter ATP-binding protein n=1 Tax=Streptomyces qinglanensis TaxID=943816 RepID=UPI003D72D79D
MRAHVVVPVDRAAPPASTSAADGADAAGPRTPAARGGLLNYLHAQRYRLAAGMALGLLGSVLALAQPLAAKLVIDRLSADEPILTAVTVLSLLVLGGALTSGLGHFVLQAAAENAVWQVRRRLISRLLHLRVSVVEEAGPGDLIARVTTDTTLLRQTAHQAVASCVTGALSIVATLVLMSTLDPLLLAATVAVAGVAAAGSAVAAPRIGKATLEVQTALGGIGAGLERALGAFRTVKAAVAEHREAERLQESADHARRMGLKAACWEATSATASAVVVQIAFLVVLGIGGARVASGALSVSALVAFLLYVFALGPRVAQLAEGVNQVQIAAAAIKRIEQVRTLETERTRALVSAHQFPATGSPPVPGVEFRSVTFSYGQDQPGVLHEVSLHLPGSSGLTAVVGPSGAGKSTLFSLLEGFHDPDSGSILVDGTDIRARSLSDLRGTIGYVEQDSSALHGTVRENLTLGRHDATAAQIAEALSLARLETVVARLPHGVDTRIGHRGAHLSGGERQRLAIARALLRRPRILLLDEATSHLDGVNEAQLNATLRDIAQRTTVIAIAHRLSTVKTAQRIIVMDSGRVVGTGTHESLLRTCPLYQDLSGGGAFA